MKKLYLCLVFCLCCSAQAQTINFQLQGDYTAGLQISTPRFAVGDLNNDGKPDLVSASPSSQTDNIRIWLNNGTGGFGTSSSPDINSNTQALALADFNNDGNLDLAAGNTTLNAGLVIYLGNGAGGFGTPLTAISTVESVNEIAVADFNGDGNQDLVVTKTLGYNTQPTYAVKVLLGGGNGFFGQPISYPTGFQPKDIEISDFNGDGKPDMAVANNINNNAVSIFLNDGAGNLGAAIQIALPQSGERIVSADFNRDCNADLALSTNNGIQVLLGNGAGGFAAPIFTAVANIPTALAVGDFNLDRLPDLAVGLFSTSGGLGARIMPGNGAGGFGSPFLLDPPSKTDYIAVLDVNLDGRQDLVLSRPTGIFSLYANTTSLPAARHTAENDFDGDGRSDISVFRPFNGTWYLNRSRDGFLAAQFGAAGDKLPTADYDGDGKTDLTVWRESRIGDPNKSYFFILQSATNTVREEQFGQPGDVPTVIGDWDGDGKPDLAVYRNGATAGAQSFFFYRPSGTPGINFRTIYWGASGDAPVRGDFDGDGKSDTAVFRPSTGLWYVQQSSNGQIRYQSWGLASDRRVPADYDGDGKTDFAVFRNGTWYILASSTNTQIYWQWGVASDILTPGDYNGDGTTDVAVYRPSEQRWYIPRCANFNAQYVQFGASGDVAVPSAYFP